MAHGRDTEHRTRKLPKESKTLPIFGSSERGNGIDDGKYFNCWYCGFVCNVDRDALGGAESGSGEAHIDFSTPSYGGINGDPLSAMSILDGIDAFEVGMELNSSGDLKTIKADFSTNISGGCPNCGSKNWKGDYP